MLYEVITAQPPGERRNGAAAESIDMIRRKFASLMLLALPGLVLAEHMSASGYIMSYHWVGIVSLSVFLLALLAVAVEEFIDLPKSKPMLLAAGIV